MPDKMASYCLVFKPIDEELYSSFAKEYSEDNAGIDVYCKDDVEIEPGKMVMLKLGLAAKLISSGSDGGGNRTYHYWLLPRSSISKKGLVMANSVGVIDMTYRGELMGAVVNVSGDPVKVARGERLFQIVAPDMGHIRRAVRAAEYNNDAAERNYELKEKEYRNAFAAAGSAAGATPDAVKTIRDIYPELYEKLRGMRYDVDMAARFRPSVVPRLSAIEDGKWVAIVNGELYGPFDDEVALDSEIAPIATNCLCVSKFIVNRVQLGLTIMDDTRRGAGGFGSTGV